MTNPEQQRSEVMLPEPVRCAILTLLHAARQGQYTGTAAVRINFNQGGVSAARAYLETPAKATK